MERRQFLKSTGAVLTASALGTLSAPSILRAQNAPIRIGLMAPLSGVVAAGGREIVEGFNLFWEERGNAIAGRSIEVIIEDDAGNPDTALQKARRLVEQEKVDFLFGNLLANTGLAVANYVKDNGTPYFIPVIAADDLTQRQRIRNVIRVAGYTASQMPRPLADWALKQGYKRIATIAQDYSFGHEQCAGFAQVFSQGGGEIVGQLWNPLNTADFSPYIGQLASMDLDAVFAMELGADAAVTQIGRRLEGTGAGLDDLVRLTYFVTDITLRKEANDQFEDLWPDSPPARSFIGVASLPRNANVEIEVVARVPQGTGVDGKGNTA